METACALRDTASFRGHNDVDRLSRLVPADHDVLMLIAGRFSHLAERFGKKLGISPAEAE